MSEISRKGFTPVHKNIHFLWEESEQSNTSASHLKVEALKEYRKAIKADDEFKKVHLSIKAAGASGAASLPQQKQWYFCMVNLWPSGS
jgi:hypothetical protein